MSNLSLFAVRRRFSLLSPFLSLYLNQQRMLTWAILTSTWSGGGGGPRGPRRRCRPSAGFVHCRRRRLCLGRRYHRRRRCALLQRGLRAACRSDRGSGSANAFDGCARCRPREKERRREIDDRFCRRRHQKAVAAAAAGEVEGGAGTPRLGWARSSSSWRDGGDDGMRVVSLAHSLSAACVREKMREKEEEKGVISFFLLRLEE